MRSGKQAPQQGFIFVALLIGLAIIGVGLGATAEIWTLTRQREKEEDLLFVGNQIRQAISYYYLQSPPAARRFPMSLDELVEDIRAPDKPARFLRRLYLDPMTLGKSWGEVRLPNGQLVGVHSLSSDKPIKVFGFALRDKSFLDKDRYSEWIFRSSLPAANPVLAAGAAYSGPATGLPSAPSRPGPVLRPDNTPPPPGVILPVPRSR